MKKILVGSFVSMVSLVSVASAEVVHESYQFKGESAQASFYSGDECSWSSAYIWGGEQVAHGTGGQPQHYASANAYVYGYNWCTGTSIEGSGWVDGGVTVNNLSSASIEVPVTFYSWSCWFDDLNGWWQCDQTIEGTATFTASLTADGDTFHGRHSSSWHGGRTHAGDRFNGKYRNATATGSLVFNGTQLIGGESWGQIENANAGSHFVTKY